MERGHAADEEGSMNEDEFLQDFVLLPPDDLSPRTRECFLASRKGDRRHKWNCPDCLEVDATIAP